MRRRLRYIPMALIGLVALMWIGLAGPAFALGNLLAFVGIILVSTALHELGHAVVATLVRFRVVRIVTGSGPLLVKMLIRRTEVELRLLPTGGRAHLAAIDASGFRRGLRVRHFLTAAGGPAVNIAIAVWGASLVPATWGVFTVLSDGTEIGWRVASMATSVNVIMAIENLIPRGGTDGGVMWWLMRAHDDDVAELGDHLSVSESMMHMGDGNVDAALAATAHFDDSTDNTAGIAARATALLMAEEFAEAYRMFEQLVGEEMPLERRVVVANNLAWAAVHLGPDHLADADRWSATAMQLADPAPTAILSTRARVLAELGRTEEGHPVALAALAGAGDRERAGIHATLALFDLQRGDAFRARGNIDEAHRHEPESRSVATIRAMVDERSLALVREQAVVHDDGSVDLPEVWASPAGRSTTIAARRALADGDGATDPADQALALALDAVLGIAVPR